jgi:type IV pilus assembly protein PilY1
MPDACYLNGVTCYSYDSSYNQVSGYDYINTINNDALIDASNNGLYYNPTITYVPPVKADGTSYPYMTDMTNVPVNGFSTSTAVDLTNYSSGDVNGEANSDNDALNYSTTMTKNEPVSKTYSQSSSSSNSCKQTYNGTSGAYGGYTYTPGSSGSSGTCVFTYNTTQAVQINYFQYSTGAAAGPYTDYYVASTDCGGQTNCVLASDNTGKAAPSGVVAGTNIATWFAYYHTRILMAKSGLMTAFSAVDKTYRVGFGSIDGDARNNNAGNLPSATWGYSDSYNGGTNYIATVQPFGDGVTGTSDQRRAFWSWLIPLKPGGGTPLRMALDAVGQYYESDQPWQTDTTDPTSSLLACRQSYTILTTDGFWNESFSGAGNADGTNGTQVTGPNGQSYTYTAAAPYKDSKSNTLADVAMKYWETDLKSNIANEVIPSTEDPAFWQHMTTFTLGLGFTPTGIAPSGTTVSQVFSWATGGGAAISNFAWPTPASNSIYNIADLAHAAVNGHGGFYSATTPQAFASALSDALRRAAERVGTGASLAANSTQLQTGSVAYQANYYTAKWKGDLKAYSINPSTGAISTSPNWTAVNALPAAASRTIYTYNPSATSGNQLVAFTAANLTSLSSAEQSALGSGTTAQTNMINYLRGTSTLEQKNGGNFRNRDTPMGDIVTSQPVYVGAPDPNQFYNETFTGTSSYVTFVDNQTSRTPEVLVAANDGMLHMFNATTGVETYAYIPGALLSTPISSTNSLSTLTQLSDPNYGLNTSVAHQYFNDGELTVADVYINSAWTTVVVGTTGRGPAKAVYALDITNPSSVKFLWERSAGDGLTNSSYIGQMIGKPVIAQVPTASGTTWAVLLGNGYNSSKGVPALMQFDLTTGALDVYNTTDTTTDNGLAAPAVWIGNLGTGVSTNAYAGDLRGQVWSFTIGANSTTTPISTGSLMFTAQDSSNNRQPITAGMLVGKDPTSGYVWVFFGTGRYLSSADVTDTSTQSWYGLIAQAPGNATLVSNLSNGRTALVQRSIVAEQAASPPTAAARAITPSPATSDMTGESGWYLDLTSPTQGAQGERMVTPNQFQGNLLLGTTRIPQASDVCTPSGSGWVMAVNPFTGTGPSSNFFDLNGDGMINSSDSIKVGGKSYAAAGVGFSALPNNPIFVGNTMLMSFDNGTTGSFQTSGTTGNVQRISWRELVTH